MIPVKKSKAQVIILDLLTLMLIVFLIITIEINIINNYNTRISNNQETLNSLKEIIIVDNIVNKYNNSTINENNTFDISSLNYKNINNLCLIKTDSIKIFTNYKQPINTYARGIVINNHFSILEVGFCE